jgi:hypothetical protein
MKLLIIPFSPTVLDLVTEMKWKVSWRWPRPKIGLESHGGKKYIY